ncbi:hypothetical protein MRX96_034318 [Rhipicephalus microplus]
MGSDRERAWVGVQAQLSKTVGQARPEGKMGTPNTRPRSTSAARTGRRGVGAADEAQQPAHRPAPRACISAFLLKREEFARATRKAFALGTFLRYVPTHLYNVASYEIRSMDALATADHPRGYVDAWVPQWFIFLRFIANLRFVIHHGCSAQRTPPIPEATWEATTELRAAVPPGDVLARAPGRQNGPWKLPFSASLHLEAGARLVGADQDPLPHAHHF